MSISNKTSSPSVGRGTTLITGASRGIGRSLAAEFARNKHDLVLVARSRDELERVAEQLRNEFGVQVTVLVHDLSRPESPQALFEEVKVLGIEVEVLVNNAGFGNWGRFATTDLPTDVDLIEVNITALTQLMKLFLQPMVDRRRGRVLNVASTGAFQPGPMLATYYASKAYVLSLSEAVACELNKTGVTLTCLCPGATSTSFMDRANMKSLRLFRFGLMDADTVARIGYRGTMAGRRIVIPGMANRVLAFSVRLAPRRFVTRLVGWLMSRG